MDKLEFLRAVLADEGFYCVVGLDKKREEGGKGRNQVQVFFEDLESAIEKAEELSENGYNAYYALGTFKDSEVEKPRGQHNVAYLKSIFLDIDYGPVHGRPSDYATAKEALEALKNFCGTTGLPKPMLVNSGGGIHAYWPLDEKIDATTWYPLAQRLKELCVEHELAADPAVTTDSARILRVPETLNFKSETPREVKIFYHGSTSRSAEFYKELMGEPLRLSRSRRGADDVVDSLVNYPSCSFKRIMKRTINGDGCEQLKYAYQKQHELDEPVWRAALSITKACIEDTNENVEKTASYLISHKHPGFTVESMQHKLSLIGGPYYCETIDHHNPGICKNCPHWGKIANPLALGRIVEEAPKEKTIETESGEVVVVPTLSAKIPWPYFRGKEGGIYKRMLKDGVESEVPILRNDLFVIRRQEDADQGECAVLERYLPKDGRKEFSLPLSVVGSKDEFRKKINYHGVAVTKYVDEIMDYVMKSVEQLQDAHASAPAYRQFGWTDDSFSGFALGDRVIHANYISPNSPTAVTAKFFPMFKPKGTLEGWKEAMEFYNRPGMELHQFQIGIGFGSILTAFTAIHAAIFHMWSGDSGIGKTTSLYAQQTIWGDPTELMMKDSDTLNSKLHRAEIMQNLPVAYDEMTNTKPEDVSTYVYSATDGKQKARMKSSSNEERTRGRPWHLLMSSTGNNSLLSKLVLIKKNSVAEGMRVLELVARPVTALTKIETDILNKQMQDNYGHAGPLFVQYVQQNLEDIKKLYDSTRKLVDKDFGFGTPYRFYSALITGALVGLMIAKRVNLVDYDTRSITAWLKLELGHIKARHEQDYKFNELEYINDFVAAHMNGMYRLQSTDDNRQVDGLDHLAIADAVPRNQYVMRYEYDIGKLYIYPTFLKKWAAKENISYEVLIEKLAVGPAGAEYVSKRMGKGLRLELPSHKVIMINWKGLPYDSQEDTGAEEE